MNEGCLDIVDEDSFLLFCLACSDAESSDPRIWPLARLRLALQAWIEEGRPAVKVVRA